MNTDIYNKRVYGCAIIKSLNANYNADFTKQPRTLPNGIVYATDKALKYTIRHFLYKNYPDDKVLYFTRNKISSDSQFVPMSLKELYEFLFGTMDKVNKGGSKTPKWMFFYYDGEKVTEVLQVVKATKIKALYKDKEIDEQDLNKITKAATEATERKVFEGKIEIKNNDGKNESLSFQEDESLYFYVDKNNQPKKIDIEDELLQKYVNDINLSEFGGYDKIKILYNLLNCIDVRLFGATFTGDTNVSIHGPVQINHGVDRFFYNGVNQNLSYTEQIKSPVRNDKAKGGEAEMTTIGSSSKTMEAHYVHNFSINPQNLDDHLVIANQISKQLDAEKDKKIQKGIISTDVVKLREALRCGATFYDSTSKAGVENELLIWVELKDGSKQVLPNFTELISVTRNEATGKVEVNLSKVSELLLQSHIYSHIEKVYIYFNSAYTKPIGIETDGDKILFKPIELEELKKEENE